jgi:hypothetical protein
MHMELQGTDGACVVPNIQVLQGNIKSMFSIYETTTKQQHQICSVPPPQIYYHKCRVSFPSKTKKQQWLTSAAKVLDQIPLTPPCRNILFQDQYHGMAVEELKCADLYRSFLDRAEGSKKKLSTALFLTYDETWHHWAATLKRDMEKGTLKIYIRSLEDDSLAASRRQRLMPTQRSLQQACQRRKWKASIHFHEWLQDSDVDKAFGWTRIWGC